MSEAIWNQILNEIQGVNRRIDGLDNRIAGVEKQMNGLDQRMDNIEKRMDNIEKRMDKIENRMDKLESEQKSQRKELQEFREETRAELQVLKGGQQGIRNEITDRFKEVKSVFEDHSFAIDILNRRQLKNEVEVEKLKSATSVG